MKAINKTEVYDRVCKAYESENMDECRKLLKPIIDTSSKDKRICMTPLAVTSTDLDTVMTAQEAAELIGVTAYYLFIRTYANDVFEVKSKKGNKEIYKLSRVEHKGI